MADDTIVTSWTVDAGQAIAAMREMSAGIEKTEEATKKMASGMAFATAAGNLLSAAFSKLTGSLKGLAKQALEWSDDMPKQSAGIDAMSKAVGGLVDKLTLAQSVEKMQIDTLRLSQSEMERVSKAAVYLGRTWNVDFGGAMERMSGEMSSPKGIVKVLRQLGIDATGVKDAVDPMGMAIDLISNKFAGVSIQAENAKERVDQLGSAFKDFTGGLGKAIADSGPVNQWLIDMREGFSMLAGLIKAATGQISMFSKEGIAAAETMVSILGLMGVKRAQGAIADAVVVLKKGAAQGMGGAPFDPYAGDEWAGRGKKGGGGKKGAKRGEEPFFPWAETSTAKWWSNMGAERPEDIESIVGGTASTYGKSGSYVNQQVSSMFDQGTVKDRGAEVAEGIMKLRAEAKARTEVESAAYKQYEATVKGAAAQKEATEYMKTVGVTALADFAGGIWAAADAAISGSQSFGMAMATMLKATLMSIAQQATVKAIWNLGQAFENWNNPGFAMHMIAAAKFGAVAVIAGGAALGMSAAGVNTASGAARDKKETDRPEASKIPSIGQRVNSSTAPIYINVYLGDPTDPSAALLARKQIEATLRRAA